MNEQVTRVIPEVGTRLAERRFRWDVAGEARMLGVCGAEPDLFGGCIDPAAFIPHAIRESVINGFDSNGMVNMVQGIVMHSPLRLDEEITVSGLVVAVEDAPRGQVVTMDTFYDGEGGRKGVVMRRIALMTDPTKKADPNQRGAGWRPEPVITDPTGLRVLDAVSLTPEEVKTYCEGTTNLIHTDPESAARAGYRAPIIGGSHGARYMTAAIWRAYQPRTLNMDLYFRRPIFWDESFDLRVDDAGGRWNRLCVARGDKVLMEIRINEIAG